MCQLRIADESGSDRLGGGFRSAMADDNLKKIGYENVVSMDGGFGAWRQAGFPIE